MITKQFGPDFVSSRIPCTDCRCCSAHVDSITGQQLKLCLWCEDGVPCPGSKRKVSAPQPREESAVGLSASAPLSPTAQGKRAGDLPHSLRRPAKRQASPPGVLAGGESSPARTAHSPIRAGNSSAVENWLARRPSPSPPKAKNPRPKTIKRNPRDPRPYVPVWNTRSIAEVDAEAR